MLRGTVNINSARKRGARKNARCGNGMRGGQMGLMEINSLCYFMLARLTAFVIRYTHELQFSFGSCRGCEAGTAVCRGGSVF
jgi:hypothetical protein